MDDDLTIGKMVKDWLVTAASSFVVVMLVVLVAEKWVRDSIDRAIADWPYVDQAETDGLKWWEAKVMDRFTRLT